MRMPAGVRSRRGATVALGVVVVLALVLALAQLVLPRVAAKRVRDRVARYGTVESVKVSAWPAVELLWGKADSASVRAGSLTATSKQLTSMLHEARDVGHMTFDADTATLKVASLPTGLTVHALRVLKHGSSIQTSATFTQRQLDEALPNGFHIEPVASEGGQVEARVSGGLFGVQASVGALVKPLEGRVVAEPEGFPFAGLVTVTLFSDTHLKVESLAVQVDRSQPLTYGLTLRGTLV
jgi:hypothetical protein